jgi:GT2 family glycosyltransferase
MTEIGIIVVTYNSAAEIGPCLDAALTSGAEIVVVDNASTDSTLVEVRRRGVRCLANPENRGFAAAVNQGFEALQTPYVLLLNPDAVLQTSLQPLRLACDWPASAGATGKLLGSDGQPQSGFMVRDFPTPAALALEALVLNRIWPGNPVNRRYRCLDWSGEPGSKVAQPAGAFLMVRRAVWRDLGGFDERFFPLWFEDVDFCRRIRDAGLNLYYVPEAVAIHSGGHSISGIPLEMRLVYWYRGLLRYAAKHFGPVAFRAVCLAVVTGSLLRGLAVSAAQRSFQPIRVYAKVTVLAGRSLLFGF